MRNEDEWDTFFDLAQTGNVSVNPKSMDEEQKRWHRAPRGSAYARIPSP
jgi:hypothetical protein